MAAVFHEPLPQSKNRGEFNFFLVNQPPDQVVSSLKGSRLATSFIYLRISSSCICYANILIKLYMLMYVINLTIEARSLVLPFRVVSK